MTELSDRLKALQEAMTKGPWSWFIEDYSLAFLHGPDEMADHVVSVSPCKSCKDSADPKEWVWGRCTTPHLADATVIALGDLFIPLAMALEEALGTIVWMSGSSDFSPDGQAHEGWKKARDDYDKWSALLGQIAERLTVR